MKQAITYIPPAKTEKQITGNISANSFVMCFDKGEGLTEKKAPFDIFAQIIDGFGEIIINGKTHLLKSGEGIIIPALKSHMINAKAQLKIILTTIKKGYE